MFKHTNKAKTFFFLFIIVAGAVVVIWSLIAGISSTRINIGMVSPAAVGIIFIIWAVFRLKHDRPLFKRRALRIAVTFFVCLGFAVISVIEAMILFAAYTPPKHDAGFVVVLGCGIYPDGHITLSLKNRLDTAYDYLTAHEDTLCIVSGGQGENEPLPEAEAMKKYLISRGIREERIIAEDRSTSTEENLIFSLSIMQGYPQHDKPVGIVTNDYHILRSTTRAKWYGINAFGIGAPTPWRVWLSCQVRECLAVMEMFVFG